MTADRFRPDMRRAHLAAAGLVVLLLLVPPAVGHPSATPALSPALPRNHSVVLAPPPTGAERIAGLLQHNFTARPSAGLPNSGYQETPPPPLPATTPTVIHVATLARGCCFYVNQTPAGGPWDAVVLNYTGTISGTVYDSSYRAYIGNAQVLFGTTPEYGTWTVLQNVTEYESLLAPGANFTFILSAAVVSGYFETSVTLSFYPPPAGGPVPSEPSKVVPIWTHQFVQASTPTITALGTVPANASAVSLELWAYGYGSSSGDEFWWASATPQRAIEIAVDGAPFAAVYPFPYVNTGGIDLFLWRPLTAASTLNDRPYLVNLTGALGALTGTHSYNATIGARHAPDPWLVAGTLLIWTNPTVTGATIGSASATWPSPNPAGNTVTSATTFHYTSTLATSAGPVNVSSSGSGTFRETTTTAAGGANATAWQNMTQSSSMSFQTAATGPGGSVYANATRAFTFGTDLGNQFVESSSTGGGYPIIGNATTYMLAFQQGWNELSSWVAIAPSGAVSTSTDAVDNEVTGAAGIFSVEEKLTSATAAPIALAYTLIQSATPKYTAERWSGPAGSYGYSHRLSGVSYQPTDPNLVETVVENRFDTVVAPLAASVQATPNPVDVGQTLSITATVRGGAGIYAFRWSGLPAGCTAGAATFVSCTPKVAGTFAPQLFVGDSIGDSLLTTPAVVVVSPALNATLHASATGADVGKPLSYSVAISGGTPPFACAWNVGGAASANACNQSVAALTTTAGTVAASVTVTDGGGSVVNLSSTSVGVHDALVVLLQATNPNATVRVGGPASFTATVFGGTPPITLVWYREASILPGLNGTTAVLVPNATGNLSVLVHASDAGGGSVVSPTATVNVRPALPTGTPSSNSGSSSGSDLTLWIALVLGAVAGVEAVFLIASRIPPKPPSRRT
jgi:hypothetical protein